MKNILISSFDMEVGGVERSLVNLLRNLNYDHYSVDLLLYKHQGDFMSYIPNDINLLSEIPELTTFRQSIREIISDRHYAIGITRLLSKGVAEWNGKLNKLAEPGYVQMQLMWKYSLPFLPKVDKEYDVAISYLWPHYYIAHKVKAKTKIAWIHTDYSTVETDVNLDLEMWSEFDTIMAVSEACKQSFLSKYPSLFDKVIVFENINDPNFIRVMSNVNTENPMLEDNRFKLVTVARLSHAKGIDNAVCAMKTLIDKGYEDISWYVVGYGGEENKIRDLIGKNGLKDRFILLGKQLNPYPFINAGDLYVQPSRYEGKAVTVLEAQILSKPVLITNYPTASSQVKDQYDGYISQLSVEGLANGIEKLYIDNKLREKLVDNCKLSNFHNFNNLDRLYQLIG